jgi:predicted dinucleotide-binding enzyme
MKRSRIGILGTGGVGRTLGSGFVKLGHEVRMGARSADNTNAAEWAKENGSQASAGTFQAAAAFADMIVLATLGTATEEVIRSAQLNNFAAKVVLDTTNPLVLENGKPPALAFGHTDSLGERVQRLIPSAKVVKVFNTVCHGLMIHPKFEDGRPDMFLAGNDPDAKQVASELCAAWGWGTADLGGIESSRLLEPMVIAWLQFGIQSGLSLSTSGTWGHAFKILRK